MGDNNDAADRLYKAQVEATRRLHKELYGPNLLTSKTAAQEYMEFKNNQEMEPKNYIDSKEEYISQAMLKLAIEKGFSQEAYTQNTDVTQARLARWLRENFDITAVPELVNDDEGPRWTHYYTLFAFRSFELCQKDLLELVLNKL